MKITQAFVAVKADGTFLRMGVQNKWGNDVPWVDETDDIERATVFAHPNARCVLGRLQHNYPHPFNFVPVEIRREVLLKGFGV